MLHPVSGVLCVEGEQTGDGRLFAEGAATWVDPPLPLAWIVEGDQHVDLIEVAPQIGTINVIARAGNLVGFTGFIDDQIPEGAELVRRMQTGSAPLGDRCGLSVDCDDYEVELVDMNPDPEADMILMVASGVGSPPAFRRRLTAAAGEDDAEGEVVMTDSSDSMIARYTRLRIRGATACSVAAFDGAYVGLASAEATGDAPAEPGTTEPAAGGSVTVTVTASGEPCEDCEQEAPEMAPVAVVVPLPAAFTAAGGPVLPPADWFTDPGFAPGDGRMVRQPDGQWLCPLTITADGRVFGHMFGWKSCHTGFVDRCQPPPRSPSDYAYFNRRPVPTADGEPVHIGILSMGCGHAPLDVSWQVAQDHYDGGPGAVQMADVHAGADAHGAWFAGALRPGVTDEQVRAFTACSVSGDWREIHRGRGIDLVACLAGVTVPGFVVTSMAASALVAAAVAVAGVLPAEPAARWVDGRAVAMVAAGVVRQPLPWERTQAELLGRLEALEGRVEAAERVTRPLQADAVGRILDGVVTATVPSPNGH